MTGAEWAIIGSLASVILTLVGFLWVTMHGRVGEVERRVGDHAISIAVHSTQKEELKNDMAELKGWITRIGNDVQQILIALGRKPSPPPRG